MKIGLLLTKLMESISCMKICKGRGFFLIIYLQIKQRFIYKRIFRIQRIQVRMRLFKNLINSSR